MKCMRWWCYGRKKKIFILMMKRGKHKILDKSVNYLEEISFKMLKRLYIHVLAEKNYVWIACVSTRRSQRAIIVEKSWICQSLKQILHTSIFFFNSFWKICVGFRLSLFCFNLLCVVPNLMLLFCRILQV